MKKTGTRLAAIVLAAVLALTGCSSNTGSAGETGQQESSSTEVTSKVETESSVKEIKDLVISKLSTNEMQTFNILYNQTAAGNENLTNLVDGLVEADSHGKVVPAIAESWETKDGGLTWTFHLRDDVKWVDVNGNVKADCTAHDFATGLEWVLNFHKNASYNTSMPKELLKGAAEYYEYTKELPVEEAKALDKSRFYEMVGVEVQDDYTIIYTCIDPKPYFYTAATYSCLYPAPQALIDELGGRWFSFHE